MANGGDTKYNGGGGKLTSLNDSLWLKAVDGAKLLAHLFSAIAVTETFEKMRDSVRLTEWLIANGKVEAFDEIHEIALSLKHRLEKCA